MHGLKTNVSAALISATFCAAASAQVPPLKLDVEQITVSGLSSGGYMANQMHLAYSDWIAGAGILAAGPYYCAKGDITVALSQCVDKSDPAIDTDALTQRIRELATQKKLADLSNLKQDKVWLFHGSRDTRINASVSDALAAQYQTFVPKQQIEYVNDKPIAHVFPTKDRGGQCMKSESPFIGSCDYDAAGDMLNFLMDDLQPASDTLSGKVVSFDQHKLGGASASTLADKGYAYIPASCAEGENCQVHVSFHGCNQYAETVGMAYVEQTGLNQWADSNNMVVVYPQTQSSLVMPLNPQGCWDWWGYTGENYATRSGKQLNAVRNIVLGLSSK